MDSRQYSKNGPIGVMASMPNFAVILVNTNPKAPVPPRVGHDGAQLPWLSDVLTMDYLVNKAHGVPVVGIEPLWDRDHTSIPNWWPLNGEMQGE